MNEINEINEFLKGNEYDVIIMDWDICLLCQVGGYVCGVMCREQDGGNEICITIYPNQSSVTNTLIS